MAEGVTYLHNQNVIHGDLKGLNVLISDAGHALITDFGNTLLNEYSLSLLNSTTSCGVSLRWAAPEILSGEGRRSTESDIYALGMTILEVITGEVPFSGMSDMEVIREVAIKRGIPRRPRRILRHGEDIEESLWSLLENCWMHDPDSRPTASRILASLRTISKDDRSKYAFNYSPVELSQSPEDREELPKAMSDAGGPECHDSRPMFSRPRTPAEPPENSEGVVRRPSWFRRMLAFIRRHLRLLV
ncbi:hypothetical protein FRC09_000602 [Ceratobasidium sp. 395]|nr:hypothetical protein FRC09_000602 [Ceratobasidium sp. 395]